MEMDSIEVNSHTVLIDSVSPENSISVEVSTNYGVYGDPEILPRVGDQYQVEIPSLTRVSDYITLLDSLDRVDITDVKSPSSLIAMSIPLTWINEEAKNKDDSMVTDRRLVPGLPNNDEMWSEVEESGFLLGLYVFGKNLGLVKDLIRSKRMGDILPYYYGRFFRGEGYRRWSECRKMRDNKKCVYGQRIFSGSRHQELLTRLLRNELEECRNAVNEMSKAFGEGRLVFEEYVFALEAKLGLQALINAVGIGKGKRDLTGNFAETPRHNQLNSRREIPPGKPLSALAPKEIISILTGDFRLSKAKTNDLFWDSVWPRLLARGWHSEQPNSSSSSLVYLVPGISKFSRSELVRGDGYYDSVTDILNLVVSKPEILDIEGFANGVGENGWSEETKSERRPEENGYNDGIDSERRRWYLKPPRTPSRGGSDDDLTMKFTVVDTSRYSNGRVRKVREIRSLPSKALESMAFSEEEGDDGDSSEAFKTRTSNGRRQTLLALPAYNSSLAKKRTKPKISQPENVMKRRKKSPLPSLGDSRLSQQETSVDLDSANNFVESSQENKPEKLSSSSVMEKAVEPPRTTIIDLNALPVSHQPVEIDQVFAMGTEETQRDEEKVAEKSPEKSPEPDVGPRLRQSMRSRPPTAKALEAIAYGFMDAKQKKKRKAKDDFDGEDLRPRTRRARPKTVISPSPSASFEPVVIDAVDFPMEETESSIKNANNGDVLNKQLGIRSETG